MSEQKKKSDNSDEKGESIYETIKWCREQPDKAIPVSAAPAITFAWLTIGFTSAAIIYLNQMKKKK